MLKENIEKQLIDILETKISEEQLKYSQNIEDTVAIPYVKFFSATELGKKLNRLSPQKANKLLQENGFQEKDEDGNWIPTILGKQFAYLIPYAIKKENVYKFEFSLRWTHEVINLLKSQTN